LLFNMHLGLAGSERGRQIERFFASRPFAQLHRRTPIIVGGDLNDLWGTLGRRFFEPRGFVRAGQLAATFPAALPVRPLDAILMRGDVTVRHARIVRNALTRVASDHLPISADVDIQGQGK
jgi:endonuclease/exonuclease/phosphatase family metal-dependent hydrolase